jgi:hypothetical protein
MRIALFHGMFVRDGGNRSIKRLKPHLEAMGHTVTNVELGFWGLLRTYFGSRTKTHKKVIKACTEHDVLVTHSRGALVVEEALELLPNIPLKRRDRPLLIHLSGSLDHDKAVPDYVAHRYVLHSKEDTIIKFSRLLPFLGMGDMGARGFTGNDRRNTNVDVTQQVQGEHSHGYFRGLKASKTARRISALIGNHQ